MNGDPTRIEMHVDPRSRRMVGVAIHGNTPFDVPFVSRIIDNLWSGGCQNGLVLPEDIEHLVSLYPWEQYEVRHKLSSVLTVRAHDSLDQSFVQLDSAARWVAEMMNEGPTLVHCQAGLNRSGYVATRALMIGMGMQASEAIALMRSRRSPAVLCNPSFEEHLRSL